MARRNNSERVGASQPDAPTPPPAVTAQQTDDIFSFISPTEFVELPSKGLLYNENHPLHGVDTVEIRHMTAKEEDILTSEALIKKGVALERLVDSLVVDKKVKANQLLIGDKNAVLIAARITGFGTDYNTSITCPTCLTSNETVLDLGALATKEMEEAAADVERLDNGNYLITFDEYKGLTVEVKLLTGADEKKIAQIREKRKRLKLPDTHITDQLQAIITQVNDISEAALLKQFIEKCPTRLSRAIRAKYETIVPDLDLTFDFECDGCAHVGKVGMPITAEFFWPKS